MKWLRCKLGAWEWVVIFFSTFSVTQGLRYTFSGEPSTLVLDKISTYVPLWIFGVMWLTAGLWAITSVIVHKRAHHALQMQLGLYLFWGMFYIITAFTGHPGQAIVAQLFLGLGGVAGGLPRLFAIPRRRR